MTIRISDDLKLPPAVVTEKLAFLGRTGSGKTYAAQKLAEELHAAGAQFVVLDPVGVWYGLRLAADGKRPGLPIPVLGGLRGDIPLEPTGGALIANLVVDRGTSVVLDVSQFESDADKARFAQAFADRFFFRKKASPSAVHLFIEECQEFVPQNPQREDARMLHAFTRLVKIGRNFGIGVSLISQRPQEVNKKVLNLAELLFAFQLTGPQERKTIEGWIADKGLDEDIAGELPKLAVGHPHVWSPAWLKVSKVIAISTKETFDASSTPVLGKAAAARELSPIDLEQLRTEMAATIEKAKAEDPKALRAEVQRLQKDLQAAQRTVQAPAGKAKTVEIQVVKPATVKAIERAIDRCDTAIARANNVAVRLHEESEAAKARGAELQGAAAALVAELLALRAGNMSGHAPARQDMPQHSGRPITNVVALRPRTVAGDTSLPRGERQVLTAIAQTPGGVTREQLTVLTGYKRSTRDTYIQRLGERRHVGMDGDRVVATQAGVDALGAGFEPLPIGDALREHWLQRLPEGERRVLEVVVKAYPGAVEREAISTATGYARSSRDSYLQRLGARRLVLTRHGQVRASHELFG
jgi:flagellar biosynthesis GTPase FlhF